MAPPGASYLTQPDHPSIQGSRHVWVCWEGGNGAMNAAEAPWGGQGKDLSMGMW